MIQLPQSQSLPREPRRTSGPAFHVGNFDHYRLMGLAVQSLENGSHPASLNERCDLEAIVEKLTNLDQVAQTCSRCYAPRR
jgi:hypothetical protein